MNLTKTPESTNLGSKIAVEVVESVKSGELRVLRRWDEWLGGYRPWLVPVTPQVLTYSDDMDEPCACARCGKRVTFGECYTSFQIHTILGIGYAVCPECHEREMAEREVVGPTTNDADTEVDANGMDAAGRGVCDCASADVPATGRSDDSGDCADNQGQVLTPITQELNERARKLGIEVKR